MKGTHRIFLDVSDLQLLTNKSKTQCYRMYKLYKDILGKNKRQRITIQEYCKLEGIEDFREVYEAIGIKNK